ncbi:MAG: GntR family transcriptional regulator [Deltaproteobacteria bacterium]|nr:GntR family transcriptional regulator [Deltaproteobacteria bacterium]MBW2076760.1 GntR family transcriptional regulator [Deltaproteobacteria bacterium]RLB30140.1 MAG: GntR family transcriptional regulator [Deltaproteobacteria bacterium]
MGKGHLHTNRGNPAPIRPIKKENLGSQVFEQIKGMILRGEIPPGRRIIESEIALSMGISRTPVREAVHKLEAEGFLTPLPKGGYAVRGLTISDIEDTFDIRSILESFAGYLAAIRHTDEELSSLEEKLEEFQRYLGRGDLRKLPKINTDFHELLYALSRSPRLIKIIHGLRDEIYFLRKIILNSEKMANLSNKDHREIVDSIRKREAKKAERLLREHIIRGKQFVLGEIKKGNVIIG